MLDLAISLKNPWPWAIAQHGTITALHEELIRARTKFPGTRFLLAALTEEVGELAQAMLQGKPREEIQKEAIQVACVAIRILEEGDSSFNDITPEESKA
jgi:NTP pyrophosphatase (non-canonical NTP hydrolase)